MESASRADVPIDRQTVSLSLVAAEWFFVEFADGATEFVLPPNWHGTLNKHTALSVRKQGPTMVTSFNTAQGSFNPHHIIPHSVPAPAYGRTPYRPHPHVPMYTGMPQFVPQPQPTYNITNVYNNMQQPQQPSSQGSGTVQLLGGALKVAASVLPVLMGGSSLSF